MKILLLLLTVVAFVAAQHDSIHFPEYRPYRPLLPIGGGPDGKLYLDECSYLQGNNPRRFGKEYRFSWCHDGGRKYDWEAANKYCTQVGPGWTGLIIENEKENSFITDIIARHRLPYIWTNGRLRYHRYSGKEWIWSSSNRTVNYTNWGLTGGFGRPQPDNFEDNEECLGILNQFYEGDTITWHDIACHHVKPIICQRINSYQG